MQDGLRDITTLQKKVDNDVSESNEKKKGKEN